MHSSQPSQLRFSGAKIALLFGEQVLTYRRDRKSGIPFPGFWDLPGGGREGNESPVECVLRELREEFSLAISPERIIWTKLYPSGVVVTGVPSFFLAGKVSAGEIARIRFGEEGERWQMMSIEDFLSRKDAVPHLQARLAECLKHVDGPQDRESLAPSDAMPQIQVSALFRGRLEKDIAVFRPTHVVSLLDPSISADRIPAFPHGTRVSRHQFFDGDNPMEHPPDDAMVNEIVNFLTEWLDRYRCKSDEVRLLVHCHMGVSRSTAIALVALAMAYGPQAECEAFSHLLLIANKPWPNLNLIRLADQRLGLHGALLDQLLSYRARYPKRLEAYRRLNRMHGGGN